MSSQPVFASSIVTPAPPSLGSQPVTVTDLSHLSKLVVKTTSTRSGGMAPPFGSSVATAGALVCGTRPDEWTVIGSADATAAAVDGINAHLVDITHGRVLVEVAGEKATSALAKVCSIDWSDNMMPDGAVVSASVAKVSCDIIRRRGVQADAYQPTYWILADRSFGQYLHEALVDATNEFNG